MENATSPAIPPVAPPRRLPLFLLGVVLFFLGPALYAIQFRMHVLTLPWYLPALATIGVFFMTISVGQHGGRVRTAFLFLLILVCGFEWYMLLVGTRTPLYTGPGEPGHHVPAFTTTLADGTTFTDKDLEKGTPSLLLFFRGRW